MIEKPNKRNALTWSLENGYPDERTDSEYPFRVHDPGRKESLELILKSYEKHRSFSCSDYRQGFNVYINVPGESLQSANNLPVELSEDVQITIKSKIVTYSEALRSYTPIQRGCFFNVERQLKRSSQK